MYVKCVVERSIIFWWRY